MKVWTFDVHDVDGFWGSIRQTAATVEEAADACMESLLDLIDDRRTNLDENFTLALVANDD